MELLRLKLIGSNRSSAAEPDFVDDAAVDLSKFNNKWYDPGRSKFMRAAWYMINQLLFNNPWIPLYGLKRFVLRRFGAKVGRGVVIKPRVNIKYPWNLQIGDHSWIGEGVHIDSLTKVTIGANCCLSQHVYLCTGSHDWSDPAFGLLLGPIEMEDGVWCGCRSTVTPRVHLASHSIIAAGSTVTKDTEPYAIYQGNPAVRIKTRRVGSQSAVSAPSGDTTDSISPRRAVGS